MRWVTARITDEFDSVASTTVSSGQPVTVQTVQPRYGNEGKERRSCRWFPLVSKDPWKFIKHATIIYRQVLGNSYLMNIWLLWRAWLIILITLVPFFFGGGGGGGEEVIKRIEFSFSGLSPEFLSNSRSTRTYTVSQFFVNFKMQWSKNVDNAIDRQCYFYRRPK